MRSNDYLHDINGLSSIGFSSTASSAVEWKIHVKVADPVAVPYCKPKIMPASCPPGQMPNSGEDRTRDDWFCTPVPHVTVMCAQFAQVNSRSVVEDIVIGLPERIAPFLKSYKASMTRQGHGRTDVYSRVVVEGERFVSDGERVGFPEGRPLLVLHDPPGLNSILVYA